MAANGKIFAELAKILLLELQSIDPSFIQNEDSSDHDLIVTYFNFFWRHIPACIRKIEKAKGFLCPENLSSDLQQLEEKISLGSDLTPYMSRDLTKKINIEKHDPLLNDWGIDHLHFTPQGGKEIMFVKVTADTIYEIGIYDHNSWTDIDVLNIVVDNWPNLIKHYKVVGDVKPAFVSDGDAIKNFRKIGVNCPVLLKDGNNYFPPGVGVMADRSSMAAHICAMEYINDSLSRLAEKVVHITKNGKFLLIHSNHKCIARIPHPKYFIEIARNNFF